MKNSVKTTLLLIFTLALSACVYKVDVQQGNEITPSMIERLTIGMSKRQVERAIGLPLISDPFNKNRWDYFYSIKEGRSGKVERQSASLFFDGDTLVDVKSRFTKAQQEASAAAKAEQEAEQLKQQAEKEAAQTKQQQEQTSKSKKPWWKFW